MRPPPQRLRSSRPVSWDPGTESGIEDPARHGAFFGTNLEWLVQGLCRDG
jgi:hypothetical protein